MIRTGRPAFHIKACTISYTNPNGDIEFYELDQKGELVRSKEGKKIIPQRVIKIQNVRSNQFQSQNNSFYHMPNNINNLDFNRQIQNQQSQQNRSQNPNNVFIQPNLNGYQINQSQSYQYNQSQQFQQNQSQQQNNSFIQQNLNGYQNQFNYHQQLQNFQLLQQQQTQPTDRQQTNKLEENQNHDDQHDFDDHNQDLFFNVNDEAIEESSTLLFGIDPNNDFDFSFSIDNEIDLI